MLWAIAALAVVGGGTGALRNNAKRTSANANLQRAYDQAELYENQANQYVLGANVEGQTIYRTLGQTIASRNVRMVARGFDAGPGMDIADAFAAHEDYANLLANAFREASNLRTQARIDTQAAQKDLDIVKGQRTTDILTGMFTGAMQGMQTG